MSTFRITACKEVTVQKSDWHYLHVHFHIIVFLANEKEENFIKYKDGG